MKKLHHHHQQKPLFLHLQAASLLVLFHHVSASSPTCIPSSGCSVALLNYIVSSGDTIGTVATKFGTSITSIQEYNSILNIDSILPDQTLSIPISCGCSDGELGYAQQYDVVSGDTISNLVSYKFSNLSQADWVFVANPGVNPNNLNPGSFLSIPMNCSCGNPDVSTVYGLFLTYVIQANDTLTSLSKKFGVQAELLTKYNEDVNLNNLIAYTDIIFVPSKDGNGTYPPYQGGGLGQASATSKAGIIGGSIGGALLLMMVLVLGLLFSRRMVRKRKWKHLHKESSPLQTGHYQAQPVSSSCPSSGIASSFVVDSGEKVIEFSYKQLAQYTDNFSMSNKIGSGGFGTVFYAEINNMKVAIKMMDVSESKQFKAEVQVLGRVHHTNLVELVGWCTENALFLVYEFVENGTLTSHLEATQRGGVPLTWASRVQIVLDSARGLEYIHEYTVPSYVHRDIKPDNILINNSLRAKVADFGLAKLGEITGTTKNAGTRGYMSPEYAIGGIISPKVDVYAFGVVLMQLISAKRAIVFEDGGNRRSLQSLFEEFFKTSNVKERMFDFVDPTLKDIVMEDEQTLTSVWKMAQLACECTDQDPDKRPDMRVVVNRLLGLVSTSQDWVFSQYNLQAVNRYPTDWV